MLDHQNSLVQNVPGGCSRDAHIQALFEWVGLFSTEPDQVRTVLLQDVGQSGDKVQTSEPTCSRSQTFEMLTEAPETVAIIVLYTYTMSCLLTS